MAEVEHGTIERGEEMRCLTDDGFKDDCWWNATSKYTDEEATFPTFKGANWWLTLIGDCVLSKEKRTENLSLFGPED